MSGRGGRARATARVPGAAWVVVPAVVMIGVAGCASRDPNRPLTADEGAKLLRDVRGRPSRARDLTPAERVYLRDKLAE